MKTQNSRHIHMNPILINLLPLLAQVSAIPGLERLLELLQTISVLIGISLVNFGAWQVHQGAISSGFLSLIAGFIAIAAIPLVRLMSGWVGLQL